MENYQRSSLLFFSITYFLFFSIALADGIHIKDDVTGGDCSIVLDSVGEHIGAWDNSTKTCTLLTDINPETLGRYDTGIFFDANNITLDGSGFSITGSHKGSEYDYGAVVFLHSNGNTLKNILVKNSGILVSSSTQTTLDNIIVSNSNYGIKVSESPYTTIINSEIRNNDTGLYIVSGSDHLNIRKNILRGNRINLNIYPSEFRGKLGNIIDTTNLIEDKIIYYFEGVQNRIFDSLLNPSQFYCISCSNITLSSTTFDSLNNKDHVILYNVASSTVINNTIQNAKNFGVYLFYATNTNFLNNITISNTVGVEMYGSSNSIFKYNSFFDQTASIELSDENDNVLIQNNDFNSAWWSIINSNNNPKIIQNNFYSGIRALDSNGKKPTMFEDLPIGGNYYAKYNTKEEGCYDVNGDDVCDDPYNLIRSSYYGDIFLTKDIFPWKSPNAWQNYKPKDSYSNILFLPGIEASRLYRKSRPDEQIQNGERKLWEPTQNQNIKDLFLDNNGKPPSLLLSDYEVYTRDVLDEVYLSGSGPNIYKSFLNQLEKLKTEDRIISDYSAVPYDWRLSLEDILSGGEKDGKNIYYSRQNSPPYIQSEIQRLAQSSRSGKVTIIAHSNGGLVTKALLKKLQDSNDPLLQKIDKVILVAVPQIGTPQAIASMLHGHRTGIPVDSISFLLSESVARDFGLNLPSVYNLLPSINYFTFVDSPVVVFGNGTEEWYAKYGSNIHSQERLHKFLTDTFDRVESDSSNIKKPITLRESLLTLAENVHKGLDAWSPPSGVEVYQIAGWGVPDTIRGIHYRNKWCFRISCGFLSKVISPEPLWTVDGDGTVVTPSALWMNQASTTRWWVNLKTYNNSHLDRSHSDILEISQLNEFIKNIITNKPLDILPTYISSTTPIADQGDTRLLYSLRAPESLSLNMYDDKGNHTGISTTTKKVETEIPDTYFVIFDDAIYIFTNSSTRGRLVITNENANQGGEDGFEQNILTTPFVFSVQNFLENSSNVLSSSTVEYLKSEPIFKAEININGDINGISPLRIYVDDDTLGEEIVFKINNTLTILDPKPAPSEEVSDQVFIDPVKSDQKILVSTIGNGPIIVSQNYLMQSTTSKMKPDDTSPVETPFINLSFSADNEGSTTTQIKILKNNIPENKLIETENQSSTTENLSQNIKASNDSQLARAYSTKTNYPISKPVIFTIALLVFFAIIYIIKFII